MVYPENFRPETFILINSIGPEVYHQLVLGPVRSDVKKGKSMEGIRTVRYAKAGKKTRRNVPGKGKIFAVEVEKIRQDILQTAIDSSLNSQRKDYNNLLFICALRSRRFGVAVWAFAKPPLLI